ncbi:MAG: cell division protein FtsZ [Bacteroidales bacterium]|nr:cell division protein FtsZ [Bacteroidales bacterium]
MSDILHFDQPKDQSSIIKVIGVGGGGSNAVNHMYRQGIRGVDFIVCNTDSQALEMSPVPVKIQLGSTLTEGEGAGSQPEVGKNAAIENIDDIRDILAKRTKMLFITAGMGGGTGTGGAPIIAELARQMDILTVGIVTMPFTFEGRIRKLQAIDGIDELRQHVDTLLIIQNDKLRQLFGNLAFSEAFAKADNILTTAAKGIAEIITVPGIINVDFRDVKTVMKESGVAIMGSGKAEGEDRAKQAVAEALTSPLLNDNDITGAKNVLLYIVSGTKEILMDEITEITDYIQNEAGNSAEIIWGNGIDEELGDAIAITIIATGFNATDKETLTKTSSQKKSLTHLDNTVKNSDPVTSYMETMHFNPEKDTITKPVNVKDNPYGIEIISPPSNDDNKNSSSENDDEVEITVHPISGDNPITEKRKKPETVHDTKQDQKHQERTQKLRELSDKLNSNHGLSEIEKCPAYLRKNIVLTDATPSSESEISRFSLGGDDEETDLHGNSFLHDNVD